MVEVFVNGLSTYDHEQLPTNKRGFVVVSEVWSGSFLCIRSLKSEVHFSSNISTVTICSVDSSELGSSILRVRLIRE